MQDPGPVMMEFIDWCSEIFLFFLLCSFCGTTFIIMLSLIYFSPLFILYFLFYAITVLFPVVVLSLCALFQLLFLLLFLLGRKVLKLKLKLLMVMVFYTFFFLIVYLLLSLIVIFWLINFSVLLFLYLILVFCLPTGNCCILLW